MNLPNALTILRIFFVPFLVAVMVEQDLRIEFRGEVLVTNAFLALSIFLFAAATDLLDGYLARRWKQITTVGTLLDPIADKLLISAALVSLVQIRQVPAWMVVLIIGREFAVTGLRSIAAAEGYTIQASDLGKTKMITQVIAISMVLLSIRWQSLSGFAMLWMWGVVIFGIASAIQYFRKFWRMVDDSTKHRRRQQLLRIERQRKRMQRSQAKAEAEKMGQAQ
ncbi:MAG TPA: CDP-diacylglycerol--glycerol-3-phosphate 3-phosphatidyltransferase [Bryobacteraceae bacterium]|jgi:CDP-diacylglycerol--glycerol-3-phosphate 3-phosphatidyltransferase|nr:CDP-diacylglycerol--glycerol-3-phosphate 3-phosphatidyltransferase [Bryobacteraceae bacterium]